MEDTPSLQSWLLEHLVLDLSVDVSSRTLDVELNSLATTLRSHEHVACLILETLQLSRVVLEAQVPKLLLLLTLWMSVKDLKQVATLLHLPVCICVDDLSEVLHQAEVRPHCICEACHLAKLRNKCDLCTCLSVLVDQ